MDQSNTNSPVELKKHTHAELEKLYTEAEQCDSEIFAEMRSNLLLIGGEHYNRKLSSFFRRIRDSKELNDQQKLRLTKNHVQNICKQYVNNIVSMAPGVGFEPKNESEIQDQKKAELHHAVWQDAKERYKIDELIDDWCDDFVGVGEVHCKIFFDPTGGQLVGHRQATDDEGNLQFDENGQPVLGESVYSGEFVFEELYGFNLLRSPEAKDIKKSPHGIIRKMVNKEVLLSKFPDKKKFIQESMDQTMVVFDGAKGGYRKTENEVLLKEFYFRPCPRYPKGWFFFSTKEGILADGELPGGVFPIVSEIFDKIQTTPRGRSPVKVMRPYQAEINRSASKMAEHQITLGDDKVLIQNGTKISAGAALPGVRSINYTGIEPKILGGRDGSQYLTYMQSQIEELYQVMNVAEDSVEKNGQLDPYAMLFRSATQKKKFQRYIKRFERFLINVAKTYIQLAKAHLPDNAVIFAVGRKEMVNIPEFRSSDDLCYEITVIPQSDDIETKMGKQLFLNHLVQYAGTQLDKQDLGKLIRLSPYANLEEGLSDLTIDYDCGTNMILALDRGEQPIISPYDDPQYMIRRLVGRARQPDFKFLPPEVQGAYAQTISIYQKIDVWQKKQIQMAEAGFIPTGGYLVGCDFYVTDQADPQKTRRARIPYESLKWLIDKLEAQGQGLDELEHMNQGALAQMAQMMTQNQGQPPNGVSGVPQAG
jgi:hypothetical protein